MRYRVLIVLILVAAAGVGGGYFLGQQPHLVANTFPTGCPTPSQTVPINFGGGAGFGFLVKIGYEGPWNATIQSSSGTGNLSGYCDYGATGTLYVHITPWNPSGEESVFVEAHKLDATHGNLTVSVTYGAAERSNSTLSPYGFASTFLTAVP